MSRAKRGAKTTQNKTTQNKTARHETPRHTTMRNETMRSRSGSAAEDSDYARRLRAAGIVKDGPESDDMKAFPAELERRIAMAINRWRGCREPLCRRMHGCMAPRNSCSNARKGPPPSEEQQARAQATIARMLAAVAPRGDDDGTGV